MDEVTRRTVVAGSIGAAAMTFVPPGSDVVAADVDGEGGDRWNGYLGAGRRSELDGNLEATDGLEVGWQLDISSTNGSPVVANGIAFLGDGNGRLLAIDVGSGSVSWAVDVDGVITLAPAADGDHVVVGTDEGTVAAFDANDGSPLWERRLNAHASTPTIHGGVVYAGAKDGTIVAFDARSGEVEWQTTIEVASDNYFEHVLQVPTPTVAGDRLVVNATDLVALDPADGSELWTTEVVRDSVNLDHVWPTMPTVTSDSIYLQLRTEIRRYDLESGVERWRTEPEFARHGAHPVSVTEDAVITAHVGGTNIWDPSRYYCLDPDDGTIRWEFEDDDAGGAMSVSGSEAYLPSRGGLVTLDLESGFEIDRLSFDDEENVENARHVNGGPVITHGGSLVFQHGGTVYALSDEADGSSDADALDDGSGSGDDPKTSDGDESDAGGSGSSSGDDAVAVEDGDDDRSLITRARIQLASDVVYLISAIIGAIIAVVRGRRYFDGKER